MAELDASQAEVDALKRLQAETAAQLDDGGIFMSEFYGSRPTLRR